MTLITIFFKENTKDNAVEFIKEHVLDENNPAVLVGENRAAYEVLLIRDKMVPRECAGIKITQQRIPEEGIGLFLDYFAKNSRFFVLD